MRIRFRLLVLVIAILLPSITGAGLGIYYVYSRQHDSYRQGIKDLTFTMALLLDKELSVRVRTLQTLAASPTLTDRNLPGFYRFAHEVASNWDSVIVLSDLSGKQFLNTRTPFGTENLPMIAPSLSEQRQRFGPKAGLISDLYFAPLVKKHSFAVQVPIERDGRILYYVAMGTFASDLQLLLKEQHLPAGWIATILDRQGVVVARTQDSEKFVGAVADAVLRKKISANRDGTNDGLTLDGIPVTAFYSRAPQSDWSIVVSVPQSALNEPAAQATILVAAIALLLIGIGVAAAAYIARRTAEPMENLRLAAADLGQGKVIARQSSGVLEIDAVMLELARANEQIRLSKAELEHRVAEAVADSERSQRALLQSQKLEALGRLTGGIAHDFNNIMQTLTTGLQLALFSPVEPRIRRSLEVCERAVERATELTRQLMAFGRVQDAHLETLNLATYIETIQPFLKGGLRANIDLQIEVEENLWQITVDPMQLELALLNVTINARDAMPGGGVIRIRMRNRSFAEPSGELAAGDFVEISVTDSGEGMTAEVLAKALDPFFTTKKVGQGSGMGLPQAYGFARQVGGALVLESVKGKGSTITFYLPRTQLSSTVKVPALARATFPAKQERGRLLFVEDDVLVSSVVVPALRDAGFDVHEAINAEQALDMLSSHGPFHVMFSDIVMPGPLSGIELAERAIQKQPGIRIVLATGFSERRLTVPGIEILAKPYDVADAVTLLSAPRSS